MINDLNEYLIQGDYSGVILMAIGSEITFHQAYGYSGLNPAYKIKTDSLFPIASITKTLTSAIALKKLQAHKIPLDTAVFNYLEDDFDPRVTFSHLLSHTSGIGLYTDFNQPDLCRQNPLSTSDFFKKIHVNPQQYGHFSYNNGNYIVLEKCLENITGKSFKNLLEMDITGPLGMNQTGMVQKTQQGDLVWGLDKQHNLALSIDYSWLGAGAGLYSTVMDIHKFAHAFLLEKIIDEALIKLAWQNHGDQYGYGWTLNSFDGKNIVCHEGGIDGFCTMLMIKPLTKKILVMLSNREKDIYAQSQNIFHQFFA